DGASQPFGTVLVAETPARAIRDLWGRDLEVVVPADAPTGAPADASADTTPAAVRVHDLWLDALAMEASDPDAHLLEPRFSRLLDADQRAMADALAPLVEALDTGRLRGSAADRLG